MSDLHGGVWAIMPGFNLSSVKFSDSDISNALNPRECVEYDKLDEEYANGGRPLQFSKEYKAGYKSLPW